MSEGKRLFDYLVFIGRFQPFHLGHLAVIQSALSQSKQVILLIGSAEQPRSTRNVFSFNERTQMILSAFNEVDSVRIHCAPLIDILYDDSRWVQSVEQAVTSITGENSSSRIGLIGHYKDKTSYYLTLFSNWTPVAVESYYNISATPIRDSYLLGHLPTRDDVPESTMSILKQFMQLSDYQDLQAEAHYIKNYKKSWSVAPYPPIFVTVDTVLIYKNRILLIERGQFPGRGLFALPGGFLDQDETLFDACLRELREETNIKLTDTEWRKFYRNQYTFDNPNRSERGRTISQAFYFELSELSNPPIVQSGDDAKRAFWLPLSELNSNKMFSDHYAIIEKMIKI
jgi:bifunctional NMN adenylyltransferase/nudix hydrolase